MWIILDGFVQEFVCLVGLLQKTEKRNSILVFIITNMNL